jgi:hypothetical protein
MIGVHPRLDSDLLSPEVDEKLRDLRLGTGETRLKAGTGIANCW